MSTSLWIVVGVAAFFLVGFILAMRSILSENREIDKHIDYSKVKPWVDDDEEEDDDK
ncbi:MAG: hypothetical protein JWM78_254 [Verrucomicrobiaceae bacterium]|nr:hypothetical protein [Verrucomicrobiaceae bacterium]